MVKTLVVVFKNGGAFCLAGVVLGVCVGRVAREDFLPEGEAAGWACGGFVSLNVGGAWREREYRWGTGEVSGSYNGLAVEGFKVGRRATEQVSGVWQPALRVADKGVLAVYACMAVLWLALVPCVHLQHLQISIRCSRGVMLQALGLRGDHNPLLSITTFYSCSNRWHTSVQYPCRVVGVIARRIRSSSALRDAIALLEIFPRLRNAQDISK